MSRIDAHTHVPLCRDRWPRFLAECRWQGVGRVVVSALGVTDWSPQPTPEVVRAANDAAVDFVRFAEGLAAWLVYLNPLHPDWPAELERGLERGAVGIKLWVSLRDAAGRTDPCLPVLAAAQRRGLPVLIHSFHKTAGNLPGELCLDDVAELAREFPDVRIVAAHAGASWRLGLHALRDTPNLCVDVCGTFPERGLVDVLVRELGAERVLFGSDMPGRSLVAQQAKVEFSDLSEVDRRLVLGGNAARVFGLDATPVPAAATATRWDGRLAAVPGGLPLPDPGEDHVCFCGQWPFTDVGGLGPAALDAELAKVGVARAFTGHLEALLAADLPTANRRFAESAAGCRRVVPLACLNPRQPNWRRVLAAARPGFAGGIVSPYVHAWRLDDPAHEPFLRACAEAHVPLWVTALLGDHRLVPTGTAWRPVSAAELTAFARTAPANDYVVQGLGLAEISAALAATDAGPARIRFDIARLSDLTDHLESVLHRFGPARLVFGSEFPFRDLRTTRWVAASQAARGAPGTHG